MILNQLESQIVHQFDLKNHYTLQCTLYFDACKLLNELGFQVEQYSFIRWSWVRLKAKRKAVDTNFVKQSYVGANPARPTI